MTIAHIKTIELDPALQEQSFMGHHGWAEVANSARYDAASGKIKFFLGYAWDETGQDQYLPNPFLYEPREYKAYLYPVDEDFEFNPSVSIVGMVRLPDGSSYRICMANHFDVNGVGSSDFAALVPIDDAPPIDPPEEEPVEETPPPPPAEETMPLPPQPEPQEDAAPVTQEPAPEAPPVDEEPTPE